MKKILSIALFCSGISTVHGQNYIGGALTIYGIQYNAATIIGSGGSVLVGNGGNWFFAGKVSSADKGNPNAPTPLGRSERITFSGTGNYSGTALVDGYVSATNKPNTFTMPVGNGITVYPITIPAGAAVTAAYFDGLGNTQSMSVNGNSTTIYSPYIDLPEGITGGNYSFSYPAGFKNTQPGALLTGNNNAAYSLLTSVPTFQSTAGSTTTNLPALGATQTYFGSPNIVLPISLTSFTGVGNGCTANLSWQTSSENNSNYYAIVASTDGNNFSSIGKVTSKNNPSGTNYSFTYKLSSSVTYFRLKAVDFDGSFTTSQIVAVNGNGACNGSIAMTVSPNPTINIINVKGLIIGSHVTVVNMNGQKLTTIAASGTYEIINLTNYASGVYFLMIQSPDGIISNVKVVRN